MLCETFSKELVSKADNLGVVRHLIPLLCEAVVESFKRISSHTTDLEPADWVTTDFSTVLQSMFCLLENAPLIS